MEAFSSFIIIIIIISSSSSSSGSSSSSSSRNSSSSTSIDMWVFLIWQRVPLQLVKKINTGKKKKH